jgi:hypothetical protein
MWILVLAQGCVAGSPKTKPTANLRDNRMLIVPTLFAITIVPTFVDNMAVMIECNNQHRPIACLPDVPCPTHRRPSLQSFLSHNLNDLLQGHLTVDPIEIGFCHSRFLRSCVIVTQQYERGQSQGGTGRERCNNDESLIPHGLLPRFIPSVYLGTPTFSSNSPTVQT